MAAKDRTNIHSIPPVVTTSENGNVHPNEGEAKTPANSALLSALGSEQPEWDLDALRLSQNLSAGGGKKLLTTIAVRRPGKQEWIRVHPDTAMHYDTKLFLVEGTSDNYYLVDPTLWLDLESHLSSVLLLPTVNREHKLFLWPVKLPGSDGKRNSWNDSALIGAQEAQRDWIRIASSRENPAYDVFLAQRRFPEPEWPTDLSLDQMLKIAFRGRYIDSEEHPIIQRLNGII